MNGCEMGIRSFQNKVPSQGERVFVDPASTVIGEVALGDDEAVRRISTTLQSYDQEHS